MGAVWRTLRSPPPGACKASLCRCSGSETSQQHPEVRPLLPRGSHGQFSSKLERWDLSHPECPGVDGGRAEPPILGQGLCLGLRQVRLHVEGGLGPAWLWMGGASMWQGVGRPQGTARGCLPTWWAHSEGPQEPKCRLTSYSSCPTARYMEFCLVPQVASAKPTEYLGFLFLTW